MIPALRLGFEPLVAPPVLLAFAILAFIIWLVYLLRGAGARVTRGLSLVLVCLLIANPTLIREEREPLPSVAVLVLDQSESMGFAGRSEAARAAYETLRQKLTEDPSLEVRVMETRQEENGTYLYSAVQGLLGDVPPDRVAGAILITDGQVHDLPGQISPLTFPAPVHALIVGEDTPGDRRIRIVNAPEFGIVGETASLVIRVDDPRGGEVEVSVSVNGEPAERLLIPAGEDFALPLAIDRRGRNVVVAQTPPGPEELTLANNRTATEISGVRDRLRVLLVTGKPNQSGRIWRDLLKSDPSVDLVHFTILRPPFKTDYASPDELALIAFPTEELFERKLGEFDLIIFDQYERQGVITQAYLENVSRYVADGGALLIIAGEPFAGPASLSRSPLSSILPAVPTGRIRIGDFVPEMTATGMRHSVTAPLTDRRWGQWLRYVEADAVAGDVLLSGPEQRPLLVLDRVAKGRVGILLSDHVWLWASGHDGGGPFAELIRRIVHWMMKEPELEERSLSLQTEGPQIRADLRTLQDSAPALELETPEGKILRPGWQQEGPGLFSAVLPADELGIYRARAGGLEAITLSGPANPEEYEDLSATGSLLRPLSDATGGGVFSLNETGTTIPDIRRTAPGQKRNAGAAWMGLREHGAYVVRSASGQSLIPPLPGALLLLMLVFLAWRREGR